MIQMMDDKVAVKNQIAYLRVFLFNFAIFAFADLFSCTLRNFFKVSCCSFHFFSSGSNHFNFLSAKYLKYKTKSFFIFPFFFSKSEKFYLSLGLVTTESFCVDLNSFSNGANTSLFASKSIFHKWWASWSKIITDGKSGICKWSSSSDFVLFRGFKGVLTSWLTKYSAVTLGEPIR